MELADFPDSEEPRPFDWILSESSVMPVPTNSLHSAELNEAAADLKLCIYLYMADRRVLYCNYMRGAKALFSVFFPPGHPLKDMHPHWSNQVTISLLSRNLGKDWSPGYELQRLHLTTRIHWSWLELTWLACEKEIWKSGNPFLIKKLERVRGELRWES